MNRRNGTGEADIVAPMGLFDRSVGSARLPRGRFAPLPETDFLRVVGESHCQAELRRLRRRCTAGPDGRPRFPAALVPEPDNPFDPHAVAVHSQTGRVGYLPRDQAQRFTGTMRRLQELGYDGGSCTGLLNGGDAERPSLGVVLAVSYAEDCEDHVFRLR